MCEYLGCLPHDEQVLLLLFFMYLAIGFAIGAIVHLWKESHRGHWW